MTPVPRSQRSIIVARMMPGAEAKVAAIFAESDRTELPALAGVRHRSLFVKDDLYLHLIEGDTRLDQRLANLREHPLFAEISQRLEPFIRPYNPATWQSPADALAREFYSFDQ